MNFGAILVGYDSVLAKKNVYWIASPQNRRFTAVARVSAPRTTPSLRLCNLTIVKEKEISVKNLENETDDRRSSLDCFRRFDSLLLEHRVPNSFRKDVDYSVQHRLTMKYRSQSSKEKPPRLEVDAIFLHRDVGEINDMIYTYLHHLLPNTNKHVISFFSCE